MNQDLAQCFSDALQLQHRPIGLAFVEEIPTQIPHIARQVPSACTFWRLGENGVF